MEKLTIEHLAPYLPYGLQIKGNTYGEIEILSMVGESSVYVKSQKYTAYGGWADIQDIKPILRPLSDYDDILLKRHKKEDWDITTQIEIVDFANKQIGLSTLSYVSYITLIKDHADVFGLIEKGLAINKNEI